MAIDFSKWSDADIDAAHAGKFTDLSDSAFEEYYASRKEPVDTRHKVSGSDVLESAKIGLEGFGVNLANTLEGVAGGVAGLIGQDETRDRLMVSVAARQKFNKEEMAGINQSAGSKVISVLSGVAPALAAAPLGVPAMIGFGAAMPTISSGLENISEGATTEQAMKQAGVDAVTNTAAMALAPGRGILAGAGIAGGSNIVADLIQDATGQVIFDKGNKELQAKYTPSLEKSLVAGASGAIPGAVLGYMGRAKPAGTKLTEPPPVDKLVEQHLTSLDRHVSKYSEAFQENGRKILNTQAGVKQQQSRVSELAAFKDLSPEAASLYAKEKALLDKKQGVLTRLEKQQKEIEANLNRTADEISRLRSPDKNLQKTDPNAALVEETGIDTTGVRNPFGNVEANSRTNTELARARMEEDAAARAEQSIEPEVVARDDAGYVQGLLDNITNLERYLATKQGTKAQRDQVTSELVQTKAELNTLQQEGYTPTRIETDSPEPKFLAVDEATGEAKTATDLIQTAIDTTNNPFLKSVLSKMLDAGGLLQGLRTRIDIPFLNKEGVGAAFFQEARLGVFAGVTDALQVAHEFTHAAANDVITRYITGKGNLLSVDQRVAVRNILDGFERVKKDVSKVSDMFKHALDDPREFVAYLTDTRFRAQVDLILKGERNGLQKILDSISKLATKYFGYTPKEGELLRNLWGNAEYLIETDQGYLTPKDVMLAIKDINLSEVTAIKGKVMSVEDIFEIGDPVKLVEEKKQRVSPIGKGDLFLSPVINRSGLALSLKASPLVRHTQAVIKRAEQRFSETTRRIVEGDSNGNVKAAGGFLRNLTNLADTDAFSSLFNRAGREDLNKAGKVALDAHVSGVPLSKGKGFDTLTDLQQRLIVSAEKALARGYKAMNDALEASGAKPMPPAKEGFLPHISVGDFAMFAYVDGPNGTRIPAYYQRFHTAQQRDAAIRLIAEKRPDVKIDPDSLVSISSQRKGEKEALESEMHKMLAEAAELGGQVDPAILDAMRLASLEARFFGGHHKFQENVAGYQGNKWFKTEEQNAGEIFKAIFNYAEEVAHFDKNHFILKQTDPIVLDPDYRHKQDPEIMAVKDLLQRSMEEADVAETTWGKQTIDAATARIVDSLRVLNKNQPMKYFPEKSVFNRVNGVLVTSFVYSTMVVRPAFHVAQAISYTIQIPSHMSVAFGDSPSKAAGYMIKAHETALDFSSTSEFGQLVERAKQTDVFKPHIMNDFTAIRYVFETAQKQLAVGTATNWLSGKRPGEMADTFSRYMAFAAMYNRGKDFGLSGDRLLYFMLDNTDAAMGIFSRAEKAPMLTQTGIVGDMASPVTNYAVMQAGWTYNAVREAIKSKNFYPVITLFAAAAITGGMANAPMLQEWELVRRMVKAASGISLPSLMDIVNGWGDDTANFVRKTTGSESAGRVTRATMNQGVFTGTAQAVAEGFGAESAPHIGAGITRQSITASLEDPNRSPLATFSAWYKTYDDINAHVDYQTGRDVTEANVNKAYNAVNFNIFHNMYKELLLPPIELEAGEVIAGGKDREAMFVGGAVERASRMLGWNTTAKKWEQLAKQSNFKLEDTLRTVKTQQERNYTDIEARRVIGKDKLPPLLEGSRGIGYGQIKKSMEKFNPGGSNATNAEAYQATQLHNELGNKVDTMIQKKTIMGISRDVLLAVQKNPYVAQQMIDNWERKTGRYINKDIKEVVNQAVQEAEK
jgi:hypothetical protein